MKRGNGSQITSPKMGHFPSNNLQQQPFSSSPLFSKVLCDPMMLLAKTLKQKIGFSNSVWGISWASSFLAPPHSPSQQRRIMSEQWHHQGNSGAVSSNRRTDTDLQEVLPIQLQNHTQEKVTAYFWRMQKHNVKSRVISWLPQIQRHSTLKEAKKLLPGRKWGKA